MLARVLALVLALAPASPALAQTCPAPKPLSFEVTDRIVRSEVGFTQGLEWRDGKLYVALVNLDPGEAMDVSLALEGAQATRVSGELLTADRLDAHNTFDAPETVRPVAFDGARLADGTLSARLPAKSLVVLTLE